MEYRLLGRSGLKVPVLSLGTSTVIIGARDEKQLRENLGSIGWSLTAEQVARLDAASEPALPYPYWHQRDFERNPFPTLR